MVKFYADMEFSVLSRWINQRIRFRKYWNNSLKLKIQNKKKLRWLVG